MIKLIDVHKTFRGQKVLNGINMHCRKGEITVLIGRSGSGKSVSLKHIIGLINPDSGQVLIEGHDITKMDSINLNETRRKFGMLFQDGAMFDSMTIEENVGFPLKEQYAYTKAEIKERVREALAQVGLYGVEHKLPSELSGGMRKRAALARAIILSPKILLYDEPTTGLDPIMTDSVNRLIVKTQQELGITSFIISHDMEAAFRIAHQICVLYQGRIIAAGSPSEIRASTDPFISAFISGENTQE
ncbi:MAG: ABC transporter ATP-binding protein, partial [Deltaproteobacteria bacterium]|nr:ABC transporter ATP-binding protein [Deltaproteobacteria bacterium]